MRRRDLDYTAIRDELRGMLPGLREEFGIREVGVFGSWVRGEQSEGSDLDLLVDFDDRPLSLLDVVRAENYISDTLGVPVDLVERSALRPRIGERILREVEPI